MTYSNDKKNEYWNHFLTLKKYWAWGFTIKRLEKIKPDVWEDESFWDDILLRHNGNNISPNEMKNSSLEHYQHCFGNFCGMLNHIFWKKGILK